MYNKPVKFLKKNPRTSLQTWGKNIFLGTQKAQIEKEF